MIEGDIRKKAEELRRQADQLDREAAALAGRTMKYVVSSPDDGPTRIDVWTGEGVDLRALTYVWEPHTYFMHIKTSAECLVTDAWGFGIAWFGATVGNSPMPGDIIKKLEARGFVAHKMESGRLVQLS